MLTQANEAKEKTQRAAEDEQRKMAMLEATMNTELTYFQDVPIPAGFAPTRMPGESTVDEGLVITDSEGNEFVWIPCTLSEYEDVDKANVSKEKGGLGWTSGDYSDDGEKELNWDDGVQVEKAKTSIKNYKGFYVARYEAGIPDEAPFSVKNNNMNYGETNYYNRSSIRNSVKYIPISKKGAQIWNYISQENAKSVSEAMYSNKQINSYLIDSQAWNHICKNIFDLKVGKNIENTVQWGNYSDNTYTNYKKINGLWAGHNISNGWTISQKYNKGSIEEEAIPNKKKEHALEIGTGLCDDFKVYNIYDMAGNVWEWTTEMQEFDGKKYAVIRGGSFDSSGEKEPVIRAGGDNLANYAAIYIGFRVVLYFK